MILGGVSAERARREMAERTARTAPEPEPIPAPAPDPRPTGGSRDTDGAFASGGTAEQAFALLDRSYMAPAEPVPTPEPAREPVVTERAPLGGASAEEARRRSVAGVHSTEDAAPAAKPRPEPKPAPKPAPLLAATGPLPGVAQEDWLRRATRGVVERGTGADRAVSRPFAPGEFTSPDPEISAHLGRTDRITYLYWTDYHNAVVANAPDKPYADLSFEGGDWHIWCVGGQGKRSRCRVGIAYVDGQSRKRLPAMTVFYDPNRSGTTVCVGTGEGGGTVTLTVDRTRPYSARDGSCFDAAQSKAILDDLNRGSSFVFTRRAPEEGEHTGWLSPFGIEKALDLMAFMHSRLSGG